MSEQPGQPDPVELLIAAFRTLERRDFDAFMSFMSPDVVLDASSIGVGTHEGAEAFRRFFEDWLDPYDAWTVEFEEIADLGGGVVFALPLQRGRLAGSDAEIQLRYAQVSEWVGDVCVRSTFWTDIEEGRAAAKTLAEDRPMAEESTTPDLVERVRSAFESLSGGDVDAMLSFLAPDAVFQGRAEGVTGRIEGAAAFGEFWEDWYDTFEEFKIEAEEILDLGNGSVYTVYRQEGRPAGTSGLVSERYAFVFEVVDGVAVTLTNYTDINEARAAAERLAKERG